MLVIINVAYVLGLVGFPQYWWTVVFFLTKTLQRMSDSLTCRRRQFNLQGIDKVSQTQLVNVLFYLQGMFF